MAQYETPLATVPGEAPARSRKWPLAAVMVIDLVLIVVAVLVLSTIVLVLFIVFRALQQGIGIGVSVQILTSFVEPDHCHAGVAGGEIANAQCR